MTETLYSWVATPVEWLHSKFGSASLSLDADKAKTAAVIVDKDGNVQVNMKSEAFKSAFEQSVSELSRLRLNDSHKG